MKMVLQKYIAATGCCSRRKAEELIRRSVEVEHTTGAIHAMPVFVNGRAPEFGMKVDDEDDVRVHGRRIKLNTEKMYIILNKPEGYTCTNRKFKDEKNIFDLIDVEVRLFSVGRLDKNSCGLVLVTNDGELTQKLTHPKFEHEKEYLVKLRIKNQEVRIKEILDNFKKGIDIGAGDGVVKAKSIKSVGDNKFQIILTEGKKRQIRRMFKIFGFEVATLKRVRIGNIKLGNLKSGEWRFLRANEIKEIIK